VEKAKTATIVDNRAARHHFELGDEFVAGVCLTGAEAKSCRVQKPSLKSAYISVDHSGRVWLKNLDIPEYKFAKNVTHERLRDRALLLHAREIEKLQRALKEGGVTAVPVNLHFSRGRAKLRFAIGRGKKKWDKREDLKKRDLEREARRGMKF